MKEDLLFAMYKDEPVESCQRFKIKLQKYKKDVNLTHLYVRITNYQIDTYGNMLDFYDPNWFEKRRKMGKDNRRVKINEYKKGNRA